MFLHSRESWLLAGSTYVWCVCWQTRSRRVRDFLPRLAADRISQQAHFICCCSSRPCMHGRPLSFRLLTQYCCRFFLATCPDLFSWIHYAEIVLVVVESEILGCWFLPVDEYNYIHDMFISPTGRKYKVQRQTGQKGRWTYYTTRSQ